MRFDNKKVLVTGASRGIGRAVALQFASAGAQVAVHYRSDEVAAAETLAGLAGAGHIRCAGDVADAAAAQRIVAQAIDGLGGLDILVNNAGIFEAHPIDEVSLATWQAAWQRTLAVNLTGPANLCWCAVEHMRSHGGGRIVNVSSRGAFRGEPRCPAYGASKAGLNALTQSLAQQVAPLGIFVGAVAPGFVETDMASTVLQGPQGDTVRSQSPLGRVARPEEVAHAVLFLASAGAEFSTGAIIDVNGASYLRS
ncbi:MAG TPA: SDR family oxidoreductase [Arenicellales bacterium]|nr:SDR family oxidoreductase [Arenicellales bacterium]HJP06723.1 SDR family oxidoreductase [Arenicellales bacterium]